MWLDRYVRCGEFSGTPPIPTAPAFAHCAKPPDFRTLQPHRHAHQPLPAMMPRPLRIGGLLALCLLLFAPAQAQDSTHFQPIDVFSLEYASDPQISPDGSQIAYARRSMDIMEDRRNASIWIVNADGSGHRPLTDPDVRASQPRWSPSGDRLLYASTKSGSSELYIRWMDTGESAKITNLTHSPSSLSWSPDGKYIAFTMFVPRPEQPLVSLPGKPQGAEWAEPANVIDDLQYRRDGSSGFVKDGSLLQIARRIGNTTSGIPNCTGFP